MDVNHIAIILDGNRRWAKDRGLDKYIGHKEGAKNLEDLTKKANEKGLKYLTVYTFSTENCKRSKEEVTYLMKIFTIYFKRLLKRVNKYNIKIKFFSSRDGLTKDLIKMIDEIEEISKNNTGLQINLCFNYGGRREITEATRKIAEDVLAGKIKPEEITEEIFSKKLYSSAIPDPDILIRTSGEKRLSNFLPWQITYSEFLPLDKYWPDFTKDDVDFCVEEFSKRKIRKGK